MKLSKIAAACAALCATQAFAHGPAVTPDLQVFISGASAQQKTLGAIASGMFSAGTIDVFYDTASNGKDYRAYFGTVSGTGTALDGKKVLIHNRAKGGSVWGVNPVARAEAISRMAVNATAGNCVSTGSAYPAATYKCAHTVNAVPDAGVSDVEPAMFQGINVATGDSALEDFERARLSPSSQLAVVFGPAVTNNVTVGLTRSQVNSLLTGAYTDWSKIPGAGSGPVTVCRRVDGSGTQASFNAFFQGYNCSNSPQTPADQFATDPGVYEVIENSTSGAVVACLNAASAAGKKAIGNLSVENVPGGADSWHFAALDGTLPSTANAASGAYDFYVEQTFQWRNQTVAGVPAPTGNLLTFLNTFLVRSGDPAIVSTLPGVAALPTLYDATAYPAGQVMKGTRNGNTCSATQLIY